MITEITPGARTGCVSIPSSKSLAHRFLICAALGKTDVSLSCSGISKDIEATENCLGALGASFYTGEKNEILIKPILPDNSKSFDQYFHLFCGESGSTLRFLLPVAGALGVPSVFHMEGNLPNRPISHLSDVLTAHGMDISRDMNLLKCRGTLLPGDYELPGNVSSQYISGLLFALPLLSGDSTLSISGVLESSSYITMTEDVLKLSGIKFERFKNTYHSPGNQQYSLPSACSVEGDFSNAAFFLCAGALSSSGISVDGLSPSSHQGDRAVLDILSSFGAEISSDGCSRITVKRGELKGCTIDASPIPDLIPTLSVVAAVSDGQTNIINAGRLRLKESDRLKSTAQMLTSLGALVEETQDGLIIHGKSSLSGGTVDPFDDHRIAMSAAVAACACSGNVIIENSQCVNKSYPNFWNDFKSLKGDAL